VISDGFDSPRPDVPLHGGVDVMFARQPSDTYKAGSPNGSKLFVMPDGMTAVAASDGVVWSAMQTPHGLTVVIDHAPAKVVTFYTHLEKLLVVPATPRKTGERVRAGQPIGVIGASPLDAEHLKHLHFEVWLGGPNDRIDPTALMRGWDTVPDPNALVARNAGLVYRPVGVDGEAGVYVIRERESHDVIYVGSSATQLYDTVTRHFQRWRRCRSRNHARA
jgi:hypothetical protein